MVKDAAAGNREIAPQNPAWSAPYQLSQSVALALAPACRRIALATCKLHAFPLVQVQLAVANCSTCLSVLSSGTVNGTYFLDWEVASRPGGT